MRKPVLGIIAIAKINHQKDEIRSMFRFYKERFGQNQAIHALFAEDVLFAEADVISAAKKMETDGADAVVFIVGTWIYSSIVISAVNDLHIPFILYGLSDKIANGNLGASLQIKYVLREMKKNFLYLCGPAQDERNISEIISYLKAAWVKNTLRNKKIATIGGKCMMMYQTQVDEFCWKRVFGMDFPHYDTLQIFREMNAVSDEEAKKAENDFLSRLTKVNWKISEEEQIPADAIFSQAKMYLAFKRMKELYGIDAFANKCMPEMSCPVYGYGYAACLATCMLNEEGIMTACEADVPAGISMYILNILTGGQKVFFADIARLHQNENGATFFNCGTAPLSLADESKGIELWPISGKIADEAVPAEYQYGKINGACIKFELKYDQQVTLLRIGGNEGSLRLHVANATTIPRAVEPDEINGQRWPGFGIRLENDRKEFLENTVGHHYSLVFGDWSRELKYLAEILEIGYVYNK